jgi:hypothetical protein
MNLRTYQHEISNKAVELLHEFGIAYLSMQVRTGKTITALNTAKLYGAKNVLFVTKKKAIPSIEADYAHFAEHFLISIINYEQLHNYTGKPQLVIIDEAHSLGQYPLPSERTKALKELCKGLPIIYLSGTPSPESYSQLYHQFWVSSNSPFADPTFYKWAKRYVTLKQKFVYNRMVNDYSNALHDEINEVCQHLFIPYTQEQAGFTQPVIETLHDVQMSQKTYLIIDKLRRDRVVNGSDNKVILADTEVKLMQKIHQLSSGTCLLDDVQDGQPTGIIFDDTKAKYIFDTFAGKRIAIFYKFRQERLSIMCEAQRRGIKLTETPEEFQKQPDTMVFISQFQSGREGINLSTADCLVCYNIDFSAITYWQMRARIQSKDRQNEAHLHWIFSKGGIEHKILNVVSAKKDFTLSYFRQYERERHTAPNY